MPSSLPNYLRRARRRYGLTQEELACLIGSPPGDGTRVSKYERFKRRPSADVMLACQFIFDGMLREIFTGAYDEARRAVATRAARLAHKIEKQPHSALRDQKLATLRALIEAGNATTP